LKLRTLTFELKVIVMSSNSVCDAISYASYIQ